MMKGNSAHCLVHGRCISFFSVALTKLCDQGNFLKSLIEITVSELESIMAEQSPGGRNSKEKSHLNRIVGKWEAEGGAMHCLPACLS